MSKILQVYNILKKEHGLQGWWPLINNQTLICEYHKGIPKNEGERFEIAIGAILAQGTKFYPNVVRALQQLKIGRLLSKEEIIYLQQIEAKNSDLLNNNKNTITPIILTQNTSWKNVEQAIKNLKENNLLTKEAIKKINIKKLESLIRCSGYYKQKAKKLKEFVRFLDSKKEITRENLLNVWGIGPETADSILLYAYNQPYFVIDAYTKRIFSRISNSKEPSYEELQSLFYNSLKKDHKLYNEYHALLIKHAKEYCKTKPICPKCPLNTICSKSKDL